MKESILQHQFSVLILKPEFTLLSDDQQQQIWESIREVVGPNILDQTQTILTKSQAEDLWDNVRSYPWSESYYERMAGSVVTAIILEGQDKAKAVKSELRSRFRPQIYALTSQVNAGFEVDIFHGSDPGQERREVKILGI